MSLLQSLVLGLIQGLTEFLPISSSAHQRIVPAMLGWDDPGAAFTAVTQLGTEAAVLIYFRRDLWRIATKWLRALRDRALRSDPDVRMGWFIVIATLPIGLLGFAFQARIETGARDLVLIGCVLIVFALVLLLADRVGRHERDLDALSVRDGVLIGLAQSAALIPGVSRSGATMTAGLLLGLERAAAARFSFLLAIPAVLTSGLFQLGDALGGGEGAGGESPAAVALATLVSFAVGYAAIAWLLRYLETHSVGVFVAYRIALGALVLSLVGAGAIA
ncbi:MAG: undecaprenyl-diphosphate phosphatase [Actinomycetota bacterium]|nr:undecaprenyl-diphosphate phosphatase [Actinomycetota bacterium]